MHFPKNVDLIYIIMFKYQNIKYQKCKKNISIIVFDKKVRVFFCYYIQGILIINYLLFCQNENLSRTNIVFFK